MLLNMKKNTSTLHNANKIKGFLLLAIIALTSFSISHAQTYTLTLQTDGTAGATTSPAGDVTVDHGEATIIEATAPTGYNFAGWTVTTGTANIQDPALPATTVTLINGNATVQANFSIKTYTLTLQTDGTAGAATSPAGGVTVDHGAATNIEVTNVPAGYNFTGWTVTSGTANIQDPALLATTVTLTDGNATVQANFSIKTYTLTLQTDGTAGATTSPAGGVTVDHGAATNIEVTNVPAGYNFTGWTVTSGTANIQDPALLATTVTLTDGDATVQANFSIKTYTLNYIAGDNGSITGTTSQTVNHGDDGNEVTADPDVGFIFVQWSDGRTDNPRKDTNVTGDISVTAIFQIKTYNLIYTPGANGSISGNLSQTVNHGANGTPVTAEPNTGYLFAGWSDGVTTATRTDEKVTANISVTANFTSIPPTAAISGTTTICHESPATLKLELTGIGPWEVTYSDSDNNTFKLENILSNPHEFAVFPQTTKTYSLLNVKDVYGKSGDVSGSATVTVDPLTVGGVVSGSNNKILLTQSTGTLTLSGHVGSVVGWRRSIKYGPWTDIPNTGTTYSETPTVAGMHRYLAVVQSGICSPVNSAFFEIMVSNSPVITDITYDASNGNLIINGQHFNQGEDIDVKKLTISNGVNSHTFNQTPNVRPSSTTRATVVISGKEKAFVNWIFNNNGTTSKEGSSYRINAAANWHGMAFDGQTTNVGVSFFLAPWIESAIYNKRISQLDVTAARLAAAPDPVKDIDVTKLTITGRGNESYTLTSSSSDVNVLSETKFVITLGATDKTEVEKLIDILGSTSSTGHLYNLGAANRWNRPVHQSYNISDMSGNQIEAIEIDNHAPEAKNVTITGSMNIGNTITGSYTYEDLESDPEGDSEFAWYRASDAAGSGSIKIAGETSISYTLKEIDAAKYIAFEVKPVAQQGEKEGVPVKSGYRKVENTPPTASNVEISGTMEVCKMLTVTFDYSDLEGDPQGNPIIKWFRADDNSGTNEQEIHNGSSYTLVLDDEDKYIRVELTPVATSGTLEGSPVPSQYVGPVVNNLSTVSISGPAEFCQGMDVDIVFELTGKSPWTVYYTNGTADDSFTATSSPYVLNTAAGGSYKVTSLVDADGCEAVELGDELDIRNIPLVVIDDWYIEEFGNTSEWISEGPSGASVNSWTFGQPDGNIFTSASKGVNIWYTNITNKNIAEQSWVTSPCFDFSEVNRPMIAIDLWNKFGKDNDGAVLQYSTNNEDNWVKVGESGKGINWYNSSQIAGMPGGQQTGWTAPDQNNFNGWIDSRYDLDLLAGKNYVRFRVAYGSDGAGQSQGGVAFDNVRIGERNRLVLLEHFTNANDANSIAANKIVYDIAKANKYDIAYISFHTSFPSSDPINSQNSADPAARSLYYGISNSPFSIMDGGLNGNGRFNYSPANFNANDLIKRALVDPGFKIDITQDQSGNELNIQVEVSSVFTFGPRDLTLHVAILETEVAASLIGLPGNEVFRNVVRKLQPDAGGTPLPSNWTANQSQTYNFNWTVTNVFDTEKLAVVAFIQDENNREVFQAGASSEFGIPTLIDLPDMGTITADIVVYPNPATDYLYIQFNENLIGNHILEVFNLSGNMILTDILREGDSNYEFDISTLPRGLYLFRIKNNFGIVGTSRVMIMK